MAISLLYAAHFLARHITCKNKQDNVCVWGGGGDMHDSRSQIEVLTSTTVCCLSTIYRPEIKHTHSTATHRSYHPQCTGVFNTKIINLLELFGKWPFTLTCVRSISVSSG